MANQNKNSSTATVQSNGRTNLSFNTLPINELIPLVDGPEIFSYMEKELLGANRYIYLTAWMLNLDFVLKTQSFRQILLSKVKKNVDIRILWCDLDQSMGHFGAKWDKIKASLFESSQAEQLEKHGIKAHVSKLQIATYRLQLIEKITSSILGYPLVLASHHQKSMVIDGNVAFCGGADIVPHVKNKNKWHDAAILIRGEGVMGIEKNFVDRWNSEVGTTPELEANSQAKDSSKCITILTNPEASWWSKTKIKDTYLEVINLARSSIYLENQYLRDPDIGEALTNALMRDVEVTIVLPDKPEEANLKKNNVETIPARISIYAQYRILKALISHKPSAVRYHISELKKLPNVTNGKIKIFKPISGPNPYIHAKLIIVDGEHTIIGSANVNGRSMSGEVDSEINTYIKDSVFASALRTKLNNALSGRLGPINVKAIENDEQVSQINNKLMTEFHKMIDTSIDKVSSNVCTFVTPDGTPLWLKDVMKKGTTNFTKTNLVIELDQALPGFLGAFTAENPDDFRDHFTDALMKLI